MARSPALRKPATVPALSIALLCLVLAVVRAAGPWSGPANLSQSGADTAAASVALDSLGRVHATWSEGGEIYHRLNAGSGWSAPRRVAAGTSPDLVAGAAGRVYLAFSNSFAGNDDVYLVSWAGAGWSLPRNISESAGASLAPRIAVGPGGSLAIVWCEQVGESSLICLARSGDGTHWSTAPIPNAQGAAPVLAFAASGNLLVAWQDAFDVGFPMEVFASEWTGSGWTLPVDVSATPMADSVLPSLVAGRGQAWLAWQEAGAATQAVYVASQGPEGWSTPQKRSGSAAAMAPALALDAWGHGHLAWTTGNAVQYRWWTVASDAWQPVEEVAAAQPGPGGARLAASSWAHAVWLAQPSAGNRDLFHSQRALPTPAWRERVFLPLVARN